ncbi:MAG: transglycosylase SLT domain-containing protein [Hydrogenophaga sp.]|uniref:lytic transglycosylase domain-containing protein n=1 Tax=Hydrogenophaga sp. TaxID=1904254 RepID=UPI0025C5AF7C|nr:lytic transglycosylase domain-containing protein [Hydrogenophaga sp.]MBT9552228.1 transglycosylase SLT domain-containing protein [Hydrogenophaga sp.]
MVLMLECPDLSVPKEVMQHVVHVESSRNPFAIGVVGGYLARQPKSLDEALAAVRQLKQEGYNFSVGIAQVNRYNLAKYGLKTYADAFDVCSNLRAGSRILRECYDRAQDWGKAFSCYYSGNFATGFEHGYVQKIFASMRKVQYGLVAQAEPVRIIPYNNSPRKLAREDKVPLGGGDAVFSAPAARVVAPSGAAAAYPGPHTIRKYQPTTPLSVMASALANAQTPARPSPTDGAGVETAENRPAVPVPGPGAIVPPASKPPAGGLSNIPTQVVGVNGDPYQTRLLPSTSAGVPAEKLPLPDLNTSPLSGGGSALKSGKPSAHRAMYARKGGSLLHSTESSGKPENMTTSPAADGRTNLGGDKNSPNDQYFVF